ncbi:MAG: right-handed parallel beta-helix repeat-containing protein [Chloroflexi bacterium]|nr:right-handed parallel beta-helix repeat-containing protein [Chloroflexota bacterium]
MSKKTFISCSTLLMLSEEGLKPMFHNRAFNVSFLLIAIIAFLFLLPAQPVLAADITVGGNCSLADAITAANSNKKAGGCPRRRDTDTIILTGSITLSSQLPEITSNITINGKGFTISGGGKHRIFWINGARKFRVENLTLSHGYIDVDSPGIEGNFGGGAIGCHLPLSQRPAVVVRNSAFRHNYALENGGAIGCVEASVDVRGSIFENNSSGAGGAIFTIRNLDVRGSSFKNNSAYTGGAIGSTGLGKVEIRNSTFRGNKADSTGGAISICCAYGEVVEIRNSTFRGNEDKGSWRGGGAIYVDTSITVRKSVFKNNRTGGKGASIYSWDGSITVVNSKLGAAGAGGFYSERGTISIQ